MERREAIGSRLADGDETALEDAYAEYAASLLAFLRRYVGADEAEDVSQRTFLDAWRGVRRYDPTSASAPGCSCSPTAGRSTR